MNEILFGMLGGVLGTILMYLWYIKSGRFGLYLDGVYSRGRARAQMKHSQSVHRITGTYGHIPNKEILEACDNLYKTYEEFELSGITHNIDKDDQYTCVLLVGRQKREIKIHKT